MPWHFVFSFYLFILFKEGDLFLLLSLVIWRFHLCVFRILLPCPPLTHIIFALFRLSPFRLFCVFLFYFLFFANGEQ